VAQPGTLTGSIGVYGGKFSLRGLYDKLGVTKEILTRGRNAAMFSEYRPWNQEERRRFRRMQESFYEDFVEKVGQGRQKTAEEVERISQGRVWHGEIRNRTKGGNLYWVEATIVPFLDARGAPIRYIAVRTEITAIKEMQQAQSVALAELRQLNELLAGRERELRASEARNRALVENLLEGLIVFSRDFVIEDLNPAAERMHGYHREELIGRPIAVLLPLDPEHQSRQFLERSVAEGLNRAAERLGRRKNGEVFPVEVQIYEVETPAGQILAAHVRDLSERHEVDRLKRQFVSTVSHELRTPLTALRGSLGLLALGVLGDLPNAAREVVSIAERNTARLVGLINDILDLERIQARQLALEKRPTRLGAVLRNARDTVDALARESAIAIEVPDVDDVVLGDGDRLIQVMVNLLSNAIKFSPPGSPVRIQAQRQGQVVRVAVIDAGRGVALEHRQAIFEPFRQAESSDARLKGGSGLGLSISRAIVEQHGGSIGVEPHDGPGATFWFTVPVASFEATR
jgi:PAS domain S-box-containing protein